MKLINKNSIPTVGRLLNILGLFPDVSVGGCRIIFDTGVNIPTNTTYISLKTTSEVLRINVLADMIQANPQSFSNGNSWVAFTDEPLKYIGTHEAGKEYVPVTLYIQIPYFAYSTYYVSVNSGSAITVSSGTYTSIGQDLIIKNLNISIKS